MVVLGLRDPRGGHRPRSSPLTALLGLPAAAAAWPWWALAAVSAVIGAGLLVGMARAGEEKPFV